MIMKLGGHATFTPLAGAIEQVVDVWAETRGIVYRKAGSEVLKRESSSTLDLRSFVEFFRAFRKPAPEAPRHELPPWAGFLLTFDVDYRRRRLHFLIEGQNRLYRLIDEERLPGVAPAAVDRLKREFYRRLDVLNRCEERAAFSSEVLVLAARLFPEELPAEDTRDVGAWARRFAASETNAENIDRLVEALGREINLDAGTREVDELLASLDPAEWHPQARREVLVNYLGFPFWDVLTFSVTAGRDAGELHEVRVDRISPQEVKTLGGFAGSGSLKGAGFDNFAGFFSRRYRENDYLLGRLHAFDRLVDIICDAAGGCTGLDVLALKRRGFQTILNAEEPHLVHSADLIADLRGAISRIGAAMPEGS
jgi:hypothetical protein